MIALTLLFAVCQSLPEASALLRGKASEELKAERLESAQVLFSMANALTPDRAIDELEKEAERKLRAAKALKRASIDLSAITDSIDEGFVARCPGKTAELRTAKHSSLTLLIDGEELVVRGTTLSRKRKQPGEIESDRIVVVSDDETLVIEGHSLTVMQRKPPGALAGRLMASSDANEREAGAMLASIKGVIGALQRLNDQRVAAGVAPVAYSAELSRACRQHARYVVNEDARNTAGLAMHEELENSPWRTSEGALAGKNSCITSYNLDSAIQPLLATLYHRVPMMAPELAEVGLGEAEKDDHYCSVIDVLSARDAAPRHTVMVPSDGQTRVPVRFANGESPDPRPKGAPELVGYPITLSWCGDGSATATIKSSRGGEVACWISTPASPANALRPDNASSVCLVPKKPLSRATKYEVTVTTPERTWTWSFTTK
jgi:hypothetical protein